MMNKLKKTTFEDIKNDVGILHKFKLRYINTIFEMLDKGMDKEDIKMYIETKAIALYHQAALKEKLQDIDLDELKLLQKM